MVGDYTVMLIGYVLSFNPQRTVGAKKHVEEAISIGDLVIF